ncbi:hypothetical protein BpHYR1_050543 [Brachionus plicatilis]|uniref:Uncharacterized protein n=1 Tax=Brachionus plicatilis TaxID=10195 RepID=A0A3M7Q3R8_BRAPC|nr:hypothetical protein BpHYR1_050543 [Brachionus plicatilis]
MYSFRKRILFCRKYLPCIQNTSDLFENSFDISKIVPILLNQIGRLNFWSAKILISQIWLLKLWTEKNI